jgi:uncharacterized protein (DUF488 family)
MSTSSTLERGIIYTLGYAQPKAEAHLERLMRNPRVLLVDVRYRPVSQWARQWNRASLAGRYRERYVWERRLGNVHYRDPEHAIELPPGYQQAVREAVALVCAGTSLVLLCACRDERACHRSLVARLIQDALPVPTAAWEIWA